MKKGKIGKITILAIGIILLSSTCVSASIVTDCWIGVDNKIFFTVYSYQEVNVGYCNLYLDGSYSGERKRFSLNAGETTTVSFRLYRWDENDQIEIRNSVDSYRWDLLNHPDGVRVLLPNEVNNEPYYQDVHRISDDVTLNEFGNIAPGSNTGLLGKWNDEGYLLASHQYWDDVGPDYFMCGHWAAYYEWFLENQGFDTKICVESGHAYIEVRLADGWYIADPTLFNDPAGIMGTGNYYPSTRYDRLTQISTSKTKYYAWWAYAQERWGLDMAERAINMGAFPVIVEEQDNYGNTYTYWMRHTNTWMEMHGYWQAAPEAYYHEITAW